MVGGELISLCIENPKISKVTSLVRKPLGRIHPKINEIIHKDFGNFDVKSNFLNNIDVVFYCIGVYTGSVKRDEFKRITVDYPLTLAKILVHKNSNLRFCLLSGAGADNSEKSRIMFSKDKGVIENKLSSLIPKNFYSFRPAYIYPVKQRIEPNLSYRISRFLYPVIRFLGPKYSIPSTTLARAIMKVGISGYSSFILENKACFNLGS